jgi:16S rRNA (adenine1518-N6/adenine1519-N6)-dimethyltransferase
VIAIEKDKTLAKDLKKTLGGSNNLQIIDGDARELLGELSRKLKTYKLAGNIPYSITGRILRILSELKSKPSLSVLTIQKEVASRIAAEPPHMNLLSAAVRFWADPEIVDFISKNEFSPKPEVDSAIIRLRTIISMPGDADIYYKFIKILFKQPRKTVLNNLSAAFSKEKTLGALKKNGIPPQSRPQNLTTEEIVSLSRKLVAEEV